MLEASLPVLCITFKAQLSANSRNSDTMNMYNDDKITDHVDKKSQNNRESSASSHGENNIDKQNIGYRMYNVVPCSKKNNI